MVGYDIDGVLVNDQVFGKGNDEHVLALRSKSLYPLIEPDDEFVLVTGRPSTDVDQTMAWVNTFFTRKPVNVFHGNHDYRFAGQYKTEVLNTHPEITTFIESDARQAAYIKKNVLTGCVVIHFETLVKDAIQRVETRQ